MTFHVGQRVRKVSMSTTSKPTRAVNPVGSTGTVVAVGYSSRRGAWDYAVQYDASNSPAVADEYQLEPLCDDDSHQVTSWEAIRKITGYVPGKTSHV